MLIKDLSIELDAKAMTAVHGGGDVNQGIAQSNVAGGAYQFVAPGLSFASSNVNVSAPTQTNAASNTALNSELNLDLFKLDVTKVAIGGIVR